MYLSYLVYGDLLQQPKQTKTVGVSFYSDLFVLIFFSSRPQRWVRKQKKPLRNRVVEGHQQPSQTPCFGNHAGIVSNRNHSN